jgi:hypothetical protein
MDLKSRAQYFVPISYLGRKYYLPLTKEIKRVLGISVRTVKGEPTVNCNSNSFDVEEGLRDIISAIYLQIRDTVAAEVHSSLSDKIAEGFKKFFEQNLDATIHTQLDNKLLPDKSP